MYTIPIGRVADELMLWCSQMKEITFKMLITVNRVIAMGGLQGPMISSPRKGGPNFFHVWEAK